jgi:hypothetical protein
MSVFWKAVSSAGRTILKGGKQKTTGKEVITKFKPKLTKGESTKVWGQKLSGKFKKGLEESTEGIDKVLTSTNRLLQKVEGKPITKSGFSKGKDLPPPKKKKD